MRRRPIVLLLLAVVVLTGGCAQSSPEHVGSPSVSYTEPPLPAAATPAPEAGAAPPTPAEDCGDPTASLRPFPDDSATPMPTVDAIRARGRLVVGLDTGSNLMSFRDPTTGAVEGFDVDVAREISRDLFGDPDRLDYRILTSANREKALQESMVDIVAKTMTITCDRKERVAFSSEYFAAQQRVLVVKGSPIHGAADLDGKRVCVVAGTTSLTRLRQVAPKADILTVPMWSDCLVVLQQRQVDAVTTDDTILAGLASQDPYLDIVGDSMGAEPYGIGITKTNDDLVRFVNGTLERIRRDGTWTEMYDRWLSMLGPSPGPPPAVYQD
ncbi:MULTISPECIES: glutamate ABC transporter substrate-binding protein [unclassified Rhodococcus (in: high G+C Gram-positive bacteria)]|uniref:glutamate ABC transporter substrate-binding protein n=1 Tax=unclassified Rhodococcus (in: high G+C Gram-positive bacteria) TaxID=192944 RepID=UPI00163A4BEB|nr:MULTISPECIES: glutamate ABC transporter substrate-binding protein [unclassified Rhodococcus (in: high G+C Gram-positive bacteria)]MBC2639588.1 glutamate ABC transporter substrate-binding protein [Rhodococcus sp. 3A]MBC2895667.1 glutamate ABC transporter substrate-binding protein [Rhodococcus sp. 4CII]